MITACEEQVDVKSETVFTGSTMGTTFMVKVIDLPDALKPQEIKAEIDKVLKDVNDKMSLWVADSELVRFNQSKETDWQQVSYDLFNVISSANEISLQSNGRFDVTLEPLIKLWGFSKEKREHEPPQSDEIKKALKAIGYKKIHLDQKSYRIKKDEPDLTINLSAIAKGFGIDQVARYLESKGVGHYMVEIGGDLRVKGSNAHRQPWKIAIETPTADSRSLHSIIDVETTGMATSGDYRNYFEKDGVRFSHIIDPLDGRPIRHKLASVTVLRKDAMTADALATTLLVMGEEDGLKWAEDNGIAAYFLIRSQDQFIEKKTSQFHAFVQPLNK
ncbi:MAG: FAD:protein FMN transferase [Methylocystaceae bacterium]|nr:FAD:protein FMN transferase [Methylocystaceae bacterium]